MVKLLFQQGQKFMRFIKSIPNKYKYLVNENNK